MFEPEWMEYFEREAPFSYYCILFLQFILMVLFYFSYLLVLLSIITTFYLLFSGIKTIKIKLVEDKKHKKLRKEKEKPNQPNPVKIFLYLNLAVVTYNKFDILKYLILKFSCYLNKSVQQKLKMCLIF